MGKAARLVRTVKLGRTALRLGPRSLWLFALHHWRRKTGAYLRATPAREWAELPVYDGDSPWNPDFEAVRAAMADPAEAAADGERILAGEIRFFSNRWKPFGGAWRTSVATGYEAPLGHWTTVPDFHPEQGDIKWIWEPSRFDWVYRLARAYAATGDRRFSHAFWDLFASWREANPPNQGPNWKCGQEASLRLFALVFAAGTFSGTPEQRGELWQTVAALAERAEPALGYAISQQNNHSLSEAAGLFVAGCCLRRHPRAAHWRALGRQVFENESERQFLPDGAYLQHSHNYTRIALRDVFVFLHVAKWAGIEIDEIVAERAQAAVGLLSQMVAPGTGRVPNYGANDGANILALSGCPYLDYRPLLQTLSVLLDGKRGVAPGPWDEELAWHGLEPDGDAIAAPESWQAPDGGYYTLRGPNSLASVRCHSFRSRPMHADLLALDVWIDGVNVCPDAGTFQYFDPDDLGSFFKSTAAHSTVEIGGESQFVKGTRFLWLDWAKSRLIRADADHWSGEHDGYRRRFGATHRRTVLRDGDDFLVVDDVLAGSRPLEAVVRWRLGAGGWSVAGPGKAVREGLAVRIAGPGSADAVLLHGDVPEATESLHYADMTPIAVLRTAQTVDGPVRWVTSIGRAEVQIEGDRAEWKGRSISMKQGDPI